MGVVLCNSYTHCLVIAQDLRGFDEMGGTGKVVNAVAPSRMGKRLVVGLFRLSGLGHPS